MITFEHVGKAFADSVAIDDLSLTIEQGEFVVVIGPSGSGKSTTLKMVNRLVEHDRGRILFEGEEIRRFEPEALRLRMGYAIQSIGLFPHWTVEQNIATVPDLLGWPRPRVREPADVNHWFLVRCSSRDCRCLAASPCLKGFGAGAPDGSVASGLGQA